MDNTLLSQLFSQGESDQVRFVPDVEREPHVEEGWSVPF